MATLLNGEKDIATRIEMSGDLCDLFVAVGEIDDDAISESVVLTAVVNSGLATEKEIEQALEFVRLTITRCVMIGLFLKGHVVLGDDSIMMSPLARAIRDTGLDVVEIGWLGALVGDE